MRLETSPAAAEPISASASSPVLRNAIWLIAAQVLTTPLAMVVNVLIARFLGPANLGTMYLVTTYSGFALLFIEWGQFSALTGKIAADRSRGGELLGSAIAWRIAAGVAISLLVLCLCAGVGYSRGFLLILALSLLVAGAGSIAAAGQDSIRGLERTDFAALSLVGQQVLGALVSIVALVLGYGLYGLMLGQVLCALVGVVFVARMLPRFGIVRLSVCRRTITELFRDGRPFLIFLLVIQLQSLVDGAMMAHFATADALGWYAASRKLLGILAFPLSAVGSALYPTLVRQFRTDPAGFRATLHATLRILSLIAFPAALGCALFPDLGVMIFNTSKFAPAEQNLRVLSLYLFLLYFTWPLSTSINASGRSGIWAGVQFVCVLVSVVADPFLISWFTAHGGNGGLGVCIATAGSEVLMLIGALLLVPRGILDGSLLRLMRNPAIAGVAMVAVALVTRSCGSLVAAALAVVGYGAVLWATGAVTATEIQTVLPGFRNRRR